MKKKPNLGKPMDFKPQPRCEYCNDKGYNTVASGGNTVMGDFEQDLPYNVPFTIEKRPCKKCQPKLAADPNAFSLQEVLSMNGEAGRSVKLTKEQMEEVQTPEKKCEACERWQVCSCQCHCNTAQDGWCHDSQFKHCTHSCEHCPKDCGEGKHKWDYEEIDGHMERFCKKCNKRSKGISCSPEPTKQEDWEKRFDKLKLYCDTLPYVESDFNTHTIKAFISSEKEKSRQEGINEALLRIKDEHDKYCGKMEDKDTWLELAKRKLS